MWQKHTFSILVDVFGDVYFTEDNEGSIQIIHISF